VFVGGVVWLLLFVIVGRVSTEKIALSFEYRLSHKNLALLLASTDFDSIDHQHLRVPHHGVDSML